MVAVWPVVCRLEATGVSGTKVEAGGEVTAGVVVDMDVESVLVLVSVSIGESVEVGSTVVETSWWWWCARTSLILCDIVRLKKE